MALTPKLIAEWFTGTHAQLGELLKNAHSSQTPKPDFDNLTVAELRQIAKNKDLKGYSALKKSELVEFLKNNT